MIELFVFPNGETVTVRDDVIIGGTWAARMGYDTRRWSEVRP